MRGASLVSEHLLVEERVWGGGVDGDLVNLDATLVEEVAELVVETLWLTDSYISVHRKYRSECSVDLSTMCGSPGRK